MVHLTLLFFNKLAHSKTLSSSKFGNCTQNCHKSSSFDRERVNVEGIFHSFLSSYWWKQLERFMKKLEGDKKRCQQTQRKQTCVYPPVLSHTMTDWQSLKFTFLIWKNVRQKMLNNNDFNFWQEIRIGLYVVFSLSGLL